MATSLLAYSSFLPSIFVPLTGFIFPAASIAFLLIYIERDDIV